MFSKRWRTYFFVFAMTISSMACWNRSVLADEEQMVSEGETPASLGISVDEEVSGEQLTLTISVDSGFDRLHITTADGEEQYLEGAGDGSGSCTFTVVIAASLQGTEVSYVPGTSEGSWSDSLRGSFLVPVISGSESGDAGTDSDADAATDAGGDEETATDAGGDEATATDADGDEATATDADGDEETATDTDEDAETAADSGTKGSTTGSKGKNRKGSAGTGSSQETAVDTDDGTSTDSGSPKNSDGSKSKSGSKRASGSSKTKSSSGSRGSSGSKTGESSKASDSEAGKSGETTVTEVVSELGKLLLKNGETLIYRPADAPEMDGLSYEATWVRQDSTAMTIYLYEEGYAVLEVTAGEEDTPKRARSDEDIDGFSRTETSHDGETGETEAEESCTFLLVPEMIADENSSIFLSLLG